MEATPATNTDGSAVTTPQSPVSSANILQHSHREVKNIIVQECNQMRETAAWLRLFGFSILVIIMGLFAFGGYVFFQAANITSKDTEKTVDDLRTALAARANDNEKITQFLNNDKTILTELKLRMEEYQTQLGKRDDDIKALQKDNDVIKRQSRDLPSNSESPSTTPSR